MSRRRLSALKWPAALPRGAAALGLAVGLVLLALIPVGIAQSQRRAQPGLQNATRALLEGRYDEVSALTANLDPQDAAVVAVNARALMARGRYVEAEAALRPAAERASGSDAALELGLLLQMLGKPDATAVLGRVASAPSSPGDASQQAREARALRALGRFYDANDAYREAAAAAPRDPAVNTGWGELFLQTHHPKEAVTSFKTALDADARWTPALLGMARALADDNPPAAMGLAQEVLKVNPNDVAAQIFLAGHAIDAGRRDEGRERLQKALAVNASSLEARSFLAALAYVEDKADEFKAEVDRVLAIAPRYGDVYRVAGELAGRNYRFDEAAVLTRRALGLEPGSARTLADLGLHLLRTGDEPGARSALEASFKIDPFNLFTLNLLRMMDTLDTFTTVQAGELVLRMHKDEAPVLQDFALRIARQALDSISARYQFKVQGPILIEIFPKHDDFAFRTFGLPGMIGALGACFGRVVTMVSPKARPPGEFQWEATLWHELAHVVTLQMSKQRLPRWLSEGISGYEEALARPEWGRPMDLEFAQILERGDPIKLADLNGAFTDPRRISLAYFQAALLVEQLVGAYGDEGLRKLLLAYGQGLETDAALKTALGTSFAELQTGYDQLAERRFGALRAAMKGPEPETLAKMPIEALRELAVENPKSFPVQMTFARAARQAGATDDAVRALERAASLVPVARGPQSPQMQLAEIALEAKDRQKAIAALNAVVATDFDNVEAARQLAGLLRDTNVTDPARLRPIYERIAAIDPFDGQAHSALGRFALERGDADAAIRQFRAVVALGPVDAAAAHTDLAESYLKGGRRAEARKQTLAALEIAPSYERAQNLLLALSETR